MKHNHRYSVLTTVTLLLWSASSFAQLSIPPDVMDAITQNGTARIIVRLDVPFTPEGYLSEAQIQAQRQQIANTQTQFETTLETTLDSMGGAIDDASGGSGTARVDVEVRTFASVPLVALEVDGQTLLAMRQDDSIKNIHLNTPDFANLNSSLGAIGADVVHQKGYQGKGQVIAIMDSGITHPTLEDKIVAEGCFSTTNAPATASSICPPDLKEFDEGTGRACDSAVSRCEHGTNVGLVAAATAPQAKLAAMQIYTEFADEFMCIGLQEPCARSYQDDQIAALGHLMELKKEGLNLTVVNLSLNDREKQIGSCDDDPRKEIIDNLLSYGVVTVVSAGNQDYQDGVSAPACISSVVAVGATDSQGNIANFSNHGGEIDLLAPGVMTIHDQFVEGTSFAAPMVAGSYAVLKAAHPNKGINEILAMLKNTGQKVDGTPLIQLDAALSQTSCDIVPEGQVACYPFSGNANDATGNGNDGTVNGATLTTDRDGNADNAYHFDGDDTIIFKSDSSFDTSDLTVSAWILYDKSFEDGEQRRIINRQEKPVPRNVWGLWVVGPRSHKNISDVQFGFHTRRILETDPIYACNATTNLLLNQWYHVSATHDSSTNQMKVYVNGQLENTCPSKGLADIISSDVGVGFAVADNVMFWQGKIDDLGVYNRVLSDSEIKELAGIEEEPITDPSCEVVKEGLVACYPFPENPKDYSGNGNHGTVNGATLTEDRFGNANNAYHFDGDDTITFKSDSSFDTSDLTVSAWILYDKAFDEKEQRRIINRQEKPVPRNVWGLWAYNPANGNGTEDVRFGFHTRRILDPQTDPIMGCSPTTKLLINQWYHVLATHDSSTNQMQVYINGNLERTCQSKGLTASISSDVGVGFAVADNVMFWQGKIDDLGVYNRVLSDSEIKQLAGVEEEPVTDPSCEVVKDGLVACYPFNGNANDGSGNGNHGTVHGPISTADRLGNPNGAYDFDGNDDLIQIADSDSLDIGYNDYTIVAWIKTSNTINNGRIFSKGSSLCVTGYMMRMGGTQSSNILVEESKDQNCHLALTGNSTINDNAWHFVVSVVDRDVGAKIFIDGNLDSQVNMDTSAYDLSNNRDPMIGANDVGNVYESFDGIIDDVRIYNRALSEAEIQTLYGLGLEQTDENRLTVTKTGNGRGTLRAKQKGEDWNIVCKSDCTEASEIYPLDSQVILTARPEKGFIFNGWSGDCSGTETRLTFTMNGAKNCTAQFEPDTSNSALLTVNTDGTGQGSVISTDGYINCGLDCSEFYRLDKRVTLEATPNADNLFLGWSGNCSGIKNPVRVTMDAAKNCTATFKPKLTGALTLSVDKQGEGQAAITGRFNGEQTLSCDKSCQQASYDYQAGDQVLLSARALKGFIFTEWTGDCSGTEPKITVLMDEAKNCTAQIDLDPNVVLYQLTINNVGTGKGSVTASGSDCTETSCTLYYQPDKVVRLKATRALFSEFVGWSGDCEGTKTAKLTMTKDLTCTAEFKSEFEILVEQMVDAFYANATLDNGDSVATQYPQNSDNRERLKEAFWLNLATLMQTDQHLGLSNSQTWPNQLNGTEWLPPDANTEYTESIQIQPQDFVGIKVELLNTAGQTQTIPVIIYYSDAMPVIDDGGGWYSARSVYFSRYVVPTWW
jgi:uncharacterized repeat protein (TIGR02543 family)